MSKTPKFDEALDEYFAKLKLDENGGQWRTCRFSGAKFYVRPEDIAFYRRIRVPLPTLSPYERTRRKLGFTNFFNLFHTKSAFSGKNIIAAYPSTTPHKIYEHEVWNSDQWDPFSFGVQYDDRRTFFDQYRDFQLSVPRPNLFSIQSTNSDYTNIVYNVRDCYLVFDALESEDCAYSSWLEYSKRCYNCYGTLRSDTCYESQTSENSFKLFFSELSRNCMESAFLYDCRNCEHCFACTNLRNKKYCFLNEQLTKEEYKKKVAEINLGNRNIVQQWQERFQELKRTAIHRAHRNEKSVNIVGDWIRGSRNCFQCTFVNDSENIAYCIGGGKARDSYDLVGGLGTELSYDTFGLSSYFTKFSADVEAVRDSEYCNLCENCTNCFGCIGLKNKSFCIFNVQHSEEEYWRILDDIKTNMLTSGEYGEFFPPEMCPIPYNISVATSFSGFEDVENAARFGYKIEHIPSNISGSGGEEVRADDVPADIKDVSDDILTKIIVDEKNGKKFRYIKKELDFHRQYNLALPTEYYTIGLERKRRAIGPISFGLRTRVCAKCGETTPATMAEDYPGAPEKVYCESCYNTEVV